MGLHIYKSSSEIFNSAIAYMTSSLLKDTLEYYSENWKDHPVLKLQDITGLCKLAWAWRIYEWTCRAWLSMLQCAEELPPCPEFIQNHTQCWCASGNLTPIDLRGAGHSGLSGRWQMTEQQIIYCCHNVTTSLALWPSVWFENLRGVDTADVTLGQNLNSELLFSILFCFSHFVAGP